MQVMEVNSWSDFKTLVANKQLNMQYQELGSKYDIYAAEHSFLWHHAIEKTSPAGTDQEDFEDDYKSSCNKPAGDMHNPFSTTTVQFKGEGVQTTATKTTTTNIDLKMAGERFVTGGMLSTKDAEWGDYIVAEVVDVDNVLGYGAGLVLKTWITKWYVIPDQVMQIQTSFAGTIPKDIYLRIKYTSVGTTNDVKVLMNYFLSVGL